MPTEEIDDRILGKPQPIVNAEAERCRTLCVVVLEFLADPLEERQKASLDRIAAIGHARLLLDIE